MPPRLFRKALTAALIFAFVLSSVALAKHTPKEHTQPHTNAAMPFVPSEQLVYDGEFSKLLLRGINIAELRFKAYRPTAASTPSAPAAGDANTAAASATTSSTAPPSSTTASPPLLLSTDVESKGWFHKLFGINFHYHVDSQVEPNAFYALRTDKLDEQGKRVRKSEAVFDQDAKKVEYTERDPNNSEQAPRVITAALEGPTQDIVSAIYFLRTQPLTPGQSFTIAVSDSGRVFQVPAVVAAEKKAMKSVLGKVAVVRVDVELFGPGRPIEQGRGKMAIWVTSDDRHVPIKARLSTDMGQLDITLKSIQRDAAQ
ncbi:MAG TPA: DUF3108 domain-containing protein [Pyrinomonadaceae bacterium]|jgi:hypothetical protein|nr:DUF3108 domain-containing protein [Pyrinomonadaceae bacterium]